MPGTLRLRVFAGPNGSGKSIMLKQVRETKVGGRPVDVGTYVNADEIARTLREKGTLSLDTYQVVASRSTLARFATTTGLLNAQFTQHRFRTGQRYHKNTFELKSKEYAEHFAQLLAAFLCDQLLKAKRKFSFETVFSHSSKLDLMRKAGKAGYKVYLYFVATNSSELNIDRIRTRVERGGHDVPRMKIIERYGRSLQQLLPGIDLCYHAFVFDNSGEKPLMFAEMKKTAIGRAWAWSDKDIPDWFIREYLIASKDPIYLHVAEEVLKARSAKDE
ncbi:MAG: zeta toxin family protein [Flavobacteriales bacterium]|nr:zeta toxin family protein [Flavobacteriales bacterium]MCC6937338.1 zeta toxin family protein [Flavobacteriales bacterium]